MKRPPSGFCIFIQKKSKQINARRLNTDSGHLWLKREKKKKKEAAATQEAARAPGRRPLKGKQTENSALLIVRTDFFFFFEQISFLNASSAGKD